MSVRESDHYLGDGLYVRDEGYQIMLFSHNGIRATNEIFLESSVLKEFLHYLEKRERT